MLGRTYAIAVPPISADASCTPPEVRPFAYQEPLAAPVDTKEFPCIGSEVDTVVPSSERLESPIAVDDVALGILLVVRPEIVPVSETFAANVSLPC